MHLKCEIILVSLINKESFQLSHKRTHTFTCRPTMPACMNAFVAIFLKNYKNNNVNCSHNSKV